ncbi:hypothetical protein AV530_001994 [Patagioenas fasciata monilis]|uniref:Uncharacterized protein n=1 Tax=Patagioenas fasciata monilis TaxID=372326 RepID=A0A1V4J6M6_PATFA|nr:hypothetical protein AV530_001994 [Patagioenas fasciata monilis]
MEGDAAKGGHRREVHLVSGCPTVSLQDQGQFLLLHQEPGQEGEQHRGSAAPARPPCPNPALFSTGPPLPTLLEIFVDSMRDHHSPATLILVSRHRHLDIVGKQDNRSSPNNSWCTSRWLLRHEKVRP